MNPRNFQLIMVVSALYLLGQLATGTNGVVAALLTCAITCGLVSIAIGGGLTTAIGALNAILIARFLLFGVFLKTMFGEPSDGTLLSPVTTAAVMALGFLGLMLGTAIQRRLPIPRRSLIPDVNEPQLHLALTAVILVVCNVSYYFGMIPDLNGSTNEVGGLLGVARMLGSLKSFAIVPALLFAWARRGKNVLGHPLVLAVLASELIVGIITTSKLGAMEPFAIYILFAFTLRGLRDTKVWALALTGVLFYATVIYPYSQYVRYHGGRQGDFAERLSAIKETLWRNLTDPSARERQTENLASEPGYFVKPELVAFNRFAMIGEADRLISATEKHPGFTGWYTILWGFEMILPRVINPNKPVFSSGNYLGHITGDINPSDFTTQLAYGVMANFFNAFSFIGAFIGTTVFFAAFYYYLRLWFNNPRWQGTPFGKTIWLFFIVALFHHGLVESDAGGLIAFLLPVPLLIMALHRAAVCLCPFFRSLIPSTQPMKKGQNCVRVRVPVFLRFRGSGV